MEKVPFLPRQAFLKRSGTDLLYFAFNMPMDLLLLCSSGFSVSLWLSLNAYQVSQVARSWEAASAWEVVGEWLLRGWK